jgi:hypothetical protein
VRWQFEKGNFVRENKLPITRKKAQRIFQAFLVLQDDYRAINRQGLICI